MSARLPDGAGGAAAAMPRRPMVLRMRRRPRGSALRVLAGTASIILLLVNIATTETSIFDDLAIGARGGVASKTAALRDDPDCGRWLVVVLCSMQVVYSTNEQPQTQELDLALLSLPIAPPGEALTVRYVADNTQRFTTSWGRARLPERIAIEAVYLMVILGLLRFAVGGMLARLRQRRHMRVIGRAPRAVVADIIDIAPSWGWTEYRLRWTDAAGAVCSARSLLPYAEAPCWADPLRTRVLALTSTRARVQVLDDELRIADFTDAERAGLRRAIDLERARALAA